MIKQTISPINDIHGNLELNYEHVASLDLIESNMCTENEGQQSKLCIGCRPNCSISYIKNLTYYLKGKLEDVKLQMIDYEPHFKKPCFNCSSSFHGSSFEDGHFNFQKMIEVEKECKSCQRHITMKRSFYHNCNICKASLKNCKFLNCHRRREHNSEKPQQCAACNLSLVHGGLISHLSKHTLSNICPYCNKGYARKISLKLHIARVCKPSSEKDFKCKLCPMEFCDQYTYKEHQDFHTKLFTCKFCDKYFSSQNGLKWHSSMHNGDWAYNCSICKKGFNSEKTLSRHFLSHSTENTQFLCKYCPKEYKRKHYLDIHMIEHTSNENLKCDLCDKTFPTHFKLNRHKSIHTKKLFQCKYCRKQFKGKGNFEKHLRNEHTSVSKKFKCESCDKMFAKQYLLNEHKPCHNDKKTFQCTICSVYTKRRKSLRRHLKRIHKLVLDGVNNFDKL